MIGCLGIFPRMLLSVITTDQEAFDLKGKVTLQIPNVVQGSQRPEYFCLCRTDDESEDFLLDNKVFEDCCPIRNEFLNGFDADRTHLSQRSVFGITYCNLSKSSRQFTLLENYRFKVWRGKIPPRFRLGSQVVDIEFFTQAARVALKRLLVSLSREKMSRENLDEPA